MSFHLGKPILVMVVASAVTGIIVAARPEPPHAKMVFWTFAESHQRSYVGEEHSVGEPPAAKYTRTTGNSLDIVQMNIRAEDIRVLSVFNTHGRGQLVPDAVEIEISKVGKFFRPPLSDIGFLPLNDFLKSSGWYDQIVQARFAPYSKQGVIFGVPHDLHPTGIAYRKDLFDEAGVDLASAKTWPEFAEACRAFKHYWNDQHRPRWPIGLTKTSSDNIVICLQQRHINLVDDSNHIFLNEPRVTQTVRLYADMVAGPDPAGADFNPAPGLMFRDLANGDVCAMIAPDWQIGYCKRYAPDLAGKLALIPLPRFEPTDSPTASWGGTMIGIPRDCKDPAASWKLIESIYFDHDSIAYRRQSDDIIPPIRNRWSDDVYQHGDPYFMNSQNANQMFIQLAEELPARYVTPFTVVAQQLLTDVLNKAVERVDAGETKNLDEDIQRWLDDASKDLAKRIQFGTFED